GSIVSVVGLTLQMPLAPPRNLSYRKSPGGISMINAIARVPTPRNEPVFSYAPQTAERAELKDTLKRLSSERVEIPLIIGGQSVRSGKTGELRTPHRHTHLLGTFQEADASHVDKAISAAMSARVEWGRMSFPERAAIFLKAADLIATKYRS